MFAALYQPMGGGSLDNVICAALVISRKRLNGGQHMRIMAGKHH